MFRNTRMQPTKRSKTEEEDEGKTRNRELTSPDIEVYKQEAMKYLANICMLLSFQTFNNWDSTKWKHIESVLEKTGDWILVYDETQWNKLTEYLLHFCDANSTTTVDDLYHFHKKYLSND